MANHAAPMRLSGQQTVRCPCAIGLADFDMVGNRATVGAAVNLNIVQIAAGIGKKDDLYGHAIGHSEVGVIERLR